MFEHLTSGAPVPPAYNKHMVRFRVGNQGNMSEHLMVDELIPFREVNDPIKNEYLAEIDGINDLYLLEAGPLRMQDSVALKIYPYMRRYLIAKDMGHHFLIRMLPPRAK
jgi:hypothetical protein